MYFISLSAFQIKAAKQSRGMQPYKHYERLMKELSNNVAFKQEFGEVVNPAY
jgi:hypothetical protein